MNKHSSGLVLSLCLLGAAALPQMAMACNSEQMAVINNTHYTPADNTASPNPDASTFQTIQILNAAAPSDIINVDLGGQGPCIDSSDYTVTAPNTTSCKISASLTPWNVSCYIFSTPTPAGSATVATLSGLTELNGKGVACCS